MQETFKMSACEPSTSFEVDTGETPHLERQIVQSTKIGELEEKLRQAEGEINNLSCKSIKLNEKLTECTHHQNRLFCVNRFMMEEDISFYTGLSSYVAFMVIFKYLNPGDNCKNIFPEAL